MLQNTVLDRVAPLGHGAARTPLNLCLTRMPTEEFYAVEI